MQIILFVAIAFGTINVVGGFLVTDRMLGMFKGKQSRCRRPDAGGGRRPNDYLVSVLYVVAFALFIYGLMGLTGPQDRGARQLDRRGRAWLIAVMATLSDPPGRATGC